MFDLHERMNEISEEKVADFNAKLAPTVDRSAFLGIRVPKLRALAKEFVKSEECEEFLNTLPHQYFEENMLHSIILANHIKDYDRLITLLDSFLPYVDNWAVCDTLRPLIFKKEKYHEDVLQRAVKWSESKDTYTCRFGIDMLMTCFLDDYYDKSILEIPAKIISDEYYVNMMLAWFYATALAKRYEDTIVYLENNRLPVWVHNKTIQKARESFRITEDQKEYLKTLKR